MDNITFIQTYCASKTYLPQITNQTITVPPCFQHLAKIPESIFIAALFLLNFKIIAKSRYKPYFIENKYKSGVDQVVTLMREPVDRAISHFYFHVTKTSGVKDEIRKYWAVLD